MTTLEEVLGTADTPESLPVVTGTVKAVTANGASVELADGRKALLPLGEAPTQKLPQAGFTSQFVELESAGDAPIVSLTHPVLVSSILSGLVPEIRSGVIQVKAVSRLPGVRAKVAVAATTEDLDPVAAVVGRAANRVKYLSEKLNGERVDVIAWHEDQEQFLRNAFAPAEVAEIKVERKNAAVAVEPHRMSAAVGKGGLNASLAGRLTGLRVVAARKGEVDLADAIKEAQEVATAAAKESNTTE